MQNIDWNFKNMEVHKIPSPLIHSDRSDATVELESPEPKQIEFDKIKNNNFPKKQWHKNINELSKEQLGKKIPEFLNDFNNYPEHCESYLTIFDKMLKQKLS